MKNFRNNRGFSTIELSVVLIIAGLLMLAVASIASMIKKSKLKNDVPEIETFNMAAAPQQMIKTNYPTIDYIVS